MIVEQMRVGFMATFCYLVLDLPSKTCALIDPAFETGKILKAVKKSGCKLTHVINTHGHSDHTAGNTAVTRATGASVLIHKQDAKKLKSLLNKGVSRALGGAGSPKPAQLLMDGDNISIGKSKLTVIHTPGHTPGGICLYGEGNLFTGDTLFVGGVGRTDLPGSSTRALVSSIKNKLYTLDDKTTVWPGHDYGNTPFSTIGREKRTNPYTK